MDPDCSSTVNCICEILLQIQAVVAQFFPLRINGHLRTCRRCQKGAQNTGQRCMACGGARLGGKFRTGKIGSGAADTAGRGATKRVKTVMARKMEMTCRLSRDAKPREVVRHKAFTAYLRASPPGRVTNEYTDKIYCNVYCSKWLGYT